MTREAFVAAVEAARSIEVAELCWCGHGWLEHCHTYKLAPGKTYCLHCYWNRYPYRTRAGSGEDIHSFETEHDLAQRRASS